MPENMEQDIFFDFDFTYGSAYIYGMLFEDRNNGKIMEHFLMNITKIIMHIAVINT